jgi:hypothetical protein
VSVNFGKKKHNYIVACSTVAVTNAIDNIKLEMGWAKA